MTEIRNCARCGRPTIPKNTHRPYIPPPPGLRYRVSANYCSTCYSGLRAVKGDTNGRVRLCGRNEPVDDAAVDRFLGGDRTLDLTPPERRAVVAHWTAHGWSARAIARELGVASRSVVRIRTRLTTVAS